MTTPALTRHTTTAAVVVVAGVAAVVSYSHMQQLAQEAGEGWRSWLIPVSIDGLVVAASMVLLTRRRAGVPGGALAWGALAAGVLASLAANMADARPEVTAVLVAGWPAAAFAVAFELLLQQRRAERSQRSPAPVSVAPAALPAITEPVVEVRDVDRVTRDASPPELASAAPVPPAVAPAPAPAAPEVARDRQPTPNVLVSVRQLVAEGLGRNAIAERLGITSHQARLAIAQVKAEQRAPLHAVGGGGR